MSNSLQPHESQHTRPPCPSPTPRVYSNPCPLNRWCHPTISSSVIPFSSCPQSVPASGIFQWVNFLHEVAKVLEFQLQHQSFQWTQQDGRRGKFTFKIKPHSYQRRSEGSKKPCAHQDSGSPQRLRENCVWVSPVEVWVSSGLPQGQGLWVQQTWVWHKPSWRRSQLTQHRAVRTYTGLGNRPLEGINRNLCAPGPKRKEHDPTRDRPRLGCECPGVSNGGVGWWWPAAELGALSVAVQAWDLLKVTIIFITSTIVWRQVNNREGTQPYPSTENWIKDLLSLAPPIRTRPSFPLSQSLPSGSIQKPLTLLEGRQTENHSHRKLTNLITWTTVLSNSMKLWAMPCGAPKMDGSWWRGLTECGPQEKGMANHFSILPLRTPWTVWKGKKIGQWKMNSPGQ